MNYKLDLQWRCNKTYSVGGKELMILKKRSIFPVNVKGDFHIYGYLLKHLRKRVVSGISSFSREYRNDFIRWSLVGCGALSSNCLNRKAQMVSHVNELLELFLVLLRTEGMVYSSSFNQKELIIIFLPNCSHFFLKRLQSFLFM